MGALGSDAGVALRGQIHMGSLRGEAGGLASRGFTASASRLGAEEFFTPFFDRTVTPENEKDMIVGTPHPPHAQPQLAPLH
jgi:hypothetical protein